MTVWIQMTTFAPPAIGLSAFEWVRGVVHFGR